MTFLDDLAARAVALGLGVIGTTLFMSSKAVIPAGAGPITSMTETGGSGPGFIHNQTTPAYHQPGAQIMVRAATYPAAKTRADELHAAFTLHNATLSGTFYLSIIPTQEPFDMGLDALGRAQLAFNVLAVRRS
jgi:Bacteriophage minor capsid protein